MNKSLKNKIWFMFISLALSFFLWLVVSGQNMRVVDISIPLEYVGLPGNILLESSLPSTATLQILANTAQIQFLDDRMPRLLLDCTLVREGANTLPLDPSRLELPRGVQIKRIMPEVVTFEALRLVRRNLPVKATIIGRPHQDYQLERVTLEPDRVIVSGSEESLDGLESIPTMPIDLSGLQEDRSLTVRVAPPNQSRGLIVNPSQVQAHLNLEPTAVEQIFSSLPINLVPFGYAVLPQGLIMKPDTAEVAVSWPSTRNAALKAEEISVTARVDVRGLLEKKTVTTPIVARAPEGVVILTINPVETEIRLDLDAYPTGDDYVH